MRRIDEIAEDFERAFGLPNESVLFDPGPRGGEGFIVVPATLAMRMIKSADLAGG